eukprot:Gb_01622 [translate_table: standard]
MGIVFEKQRMGNRRSELHSRTRILQFSILIILSFTFIAPAGCARRLQGKQRIVPLAQIDLQQKHLSAKQGLGAVLSKTFQLKYSLALKSKGPDRFLHEVHSGPNPISNSLPMDYRKSRTPKRSP